MEGIKKNTNLRYMLYECRLLIQSCSSEDEDEDGGEDLRFWCEFALKTRGYIRSYVTWRYILHNSSYRINRLVFLILSLHVCNRFIFWSDRLPSSVVQVVRNVTGKGLLFSQKACTSINHSAWCSVGCIQLHWLKNSEDPVL